MMNIRKGKFALYLRHTKTTLLFTALLLCTVSGFAQTSLSNLLPKDARSAGLGGASLVFAEGYGALWGNPAGLAEKKSVTFIDSSTWAYIKPTPRDIKNIAAILQGQTDRDQTATILNDLIAENGFGGGEFLGFGWTGEGMGLGITSITDAVIGGTGLSDSTLDMRSQTSAVLGLAWPFHFGPFALNVGASARGYYRIETIAEGWQFNPIAQAILTASNIYSVISSDHVIGGFGVSIDAGATLSFGPVGIGFMVRDFSDKFAMNESSIEDIANSYMVPSGGLDYYSVSPVYTAGLSFTLDQKSQCVPTFFIEMDDPFSLLSLISTDAEAIPSKLHIGAEIKILKFLSLRAGYNEGYISMGTGLKILFLEVNAAMFTEPVSIGTETVGRTGVMIQGAIRF